MAYRLPGPVDGGIGLRQAAYQLCKGWSSLDHHNIIAPSLIRMSSSIALDVGSP
jgi:hypothetical protein